MITGIEIGDNGSGTEVRTYILDGDVKTYIQHMYFEKSGIALIERDVGNKGYAVTLNDEITITTQRISFL